MLRAILPLILVTVLAAGVNAADDYGFDEKELEKETRKSPVHVGGYGEAVPALFLMDRDAALYRLKYYGKEPRRETPEYTLGLQLEGSAEWGMARASARVYSWALRTYEGWERDSILQEGYLTLKPAPWFVLEAGKKNFKWGKGYAWNPVAFIDRPKNPEDPELPSEGYYAGSLDLIVSIGSLLKTLAFTPVLFPFYDRVNGEINGEGHMNYAGKIYLLFLDTDIDLMFLAGKSVPDRYGADFSRNITPEMEVHGEFAWIPGFRKMVMGPSGLPGEERISAKSFLAGIRYLTSWDTTIILEYYRNGTGYRASEMKDYYAFIDSGYSAYELTGSSLQLQKAAKMQKGGYGRQSAMQNYLYLRISQKEPGDILYLTPALSFMYNMTDRSFSAIPEIQYSPLTNLELRLRSLIPVGEDDTEFGEKPSDYRFDLRVRYYF